MKGFDTKFLDELKSKTDIVKVVGKYVPLTPRGSNYWGRCPFHHEKTASFCVNSIEQFYYCFGCHK
ncbi:MAG: CHC2 zinc finger domain-containing protein, partial [Clostridia bacterium]|nr:CHC2 zinc finger domain-containing protein [Clostridia bacterium]